MRRKKIVLTLAICAFLPLTLFGCGMDTSQERMMETVTQTMTEEVTTTLTTTETTTETTTTTEKVTTQPTTTTTEKTTTQPTTTATALSRSAPVNEHTYILNTNSKKFHSSGCREVSKIKDSNKKSYTGTRDEVINMGYEPCKVCDP